MADGVRDLAAGRADGVGAAPRPGRVFGVKTRNGARGRGAGAVSPFGGAVNGWWVFKRRPVLHCAWLQPIQDSSSRHLYSPGQPSHRSKQAIFDLHSVV